VTEQRGEGRKREPAISHEQHVADDKKLIVQAGGVVQQTQTALPLTDVAATSANRHDFIIRNTRQWSSGADFSLEGRVANL